MAVMSHSYVWLTSQLSSGSTQLSAFLRPDFSGHSLTGSWAVTGEMRAYRKRSGVFNPLPVSKPVNQGGWGALELAFRYSRLDLTEGTVEGGELDVLSLGINWWLTSTSQFSVDYRDISLDRFGIQGDSSGLDYPLRIVRSQRLQARGLVEEASILTGTGRERSGDQRETLTATKAVGESDLGVRAGGNLVDLGGRDAEVRSLIPSHRIGPSDGLPAGRCPRPELESRSCLTLVKIQR
ncbi:MAG: porin [Thermoanaerobaculia bacterium]